MKKKPTWSFYGSSLVSAYWNGAATYYRGIIRALAERGHAVTFYEPDAYDRQKNRDIEDPEWAKVVVYPATPEGLKSALEQGQNADVIVKCSGVGVFDRELESAVVEMKKSDNLIVFWDVDAPATLDRIAADPNDAFRALIPGYDLILTYGGGDPVVRQYSLFSARRCIPIYNALDPRTHFPVEPDPRFEARLGLLANRLPDRERRVEQFFLKAAEQLPQHRFILGGSGWGDKPIPRHVNYLGHVYTREHNAFNCTPLAVLNLSRESMASYGFSPATRVFEAAGAKACLITDAWEGIELFLEPESEVLVARNGDELAHIVDTLTPERARAIGEAAYRRVLAHHTYSHRAEAVEQLLEDYR
ncbi:MAG: glycosyltransferase [Bdellovibrionales bacterium]